jgi:hypothetical protein
MLSCTVRKIVSMTTMPDDQDDAWWNVEGIEIAVDAGRSVLRSFTERTRRFRAGCRARARTGFYDDLGFGGMGTAIFDAGVRRRLHGQQLPPEVAVAI